MKCVIAIGAIGFLLHDYILPTKREKVLSDYLIDDFSSEEFNRNEKHKKLNWEYELRKALDDNIQSEILILHIKAMNVREVLYSNTFSVHL